MDERLIQIINYLGISVNKFEEKICVSKGRIGKTITQKTTFSTDVLEKIYSAFPQFSIDWLVTGRGEMLYKNEINNDKDGKNQSFDDVDMIKILMELNETRKRVEEMMDETTRLKVENILLKKGDVLDKIYATGTDQQVTQ